MNVAYPDDSRLGITDCLAVITGTVVNKPAPSIFLVNRENPDSVEFFALARDLTVGI
jgi:hypothetical protein